jgi:hypothetical protein
VETLKQLKRLAAEGVAVVFDTKLPHDVPGWHDLDNLRKQFKTVVEEIKPAKHVYVGDLDAGLTGAGIARESMADYSLYFVRRTFPAGLHYFIANRGTAAVDQWVTLSTKAKSVEVMDPMTGKTGIAELRTGDNGFAQVHIQLDPTESIILRTFSKTAETGPAFPLRPTGTPIELTGTWSMKFIAGGPTLPGPIQTGSLASWTTLGGSDAQVFGGTALYTLNFDAPANAAAGATYSIALGKVCQSASVRLNGKSLGTVIMAPFTMEAGTLLPKGNQLEVEVTSVSANRVRDMDIRNVKWKNFYPPGLLDLSYHGFDASGWAITDCGLLGPVMLDPDAPQG